MLRLARGKAGRPGKTCSACHRLSAPCFVGMGCSLIELLVSHAIESLAARADLGFLGAVEPNAGQIERWSKQLRGLPPMPTFAEKVNLGDRFVYLEMIMLVDRYGLDALNGDLGNPQHPAKELREAALKGVIWDPALKKANRWFDRVVAAARIADRTQREQSLHEIDNDLKKMKADVTEMRIAIDLLAGDGEAKGKLVGDVMTALLYPAARNVQRSASHRANRFEPRSRLRACSLPRGPRRLSHGIDRVGAKIYCESANRHLLRQAADLQAE